MALSQQDAVAIARTIAKEATKAITANIEAAMDAKMAGINDFDVFFEHPNPLNMPKGIGINASVDLHKARGTGYIEGAFLVVNNPNIGLQIDFENEPDRRDVGVRWPLTPNAVNFLGTHWNNMVHVPIYTGAPTNIYAVHITKLLPFKIGWQMRAVDISGAGGLILNWGVVYSTLLDQKKKKIVQVR